MAVLLFVDPTFVSWDCVYPYKAPPPKTTITNPPTKPPTRPLLKPPFLGVGGCGSFFSFLGGLTPPLPPFPALASTGCFCVFLRGSTVFSTIGSLGVGATVGCGFSSLLSAAIASSKAFLSAKISSSGKRSWFSFVYSSKVSLVIPVPITSSEESSWSTA